jgi:c-di-AMP phosphodiesterase-like protein
MLTDNISLITKLNIDDYIKVNYHLFYRRWPAKFMLWLGIFMLLMFSVSLFSNEFSSSSWIALLFPLFMIAGLPITVYFAAKRNYKTNARISETIKYEFDKEYIEVIGESFNSKQTWNKIYSVTENKDWVLIWQNQQVANVIPKRDFKNNELQGLAEIVKTHPNIKNKLKNSN